MLICGAVITLPFALILEGTTAVSLMLQPPMLPVLVLAIVVFVAQYAAMFPDCDYMLADCNGDGAVDTADIDSFVQLIVGS